MFIIFAMCQALGPGSDSGAGSQDQEQDLRIEMRMNVCIGRSLVADKASADCLCNFYHSCTVSGQKFGSDSGAGSQDGEEDEWMYR